MSKRLVLIFGTLAAAAGAAQAQFAPNYGNGAYPAPTVPYGYYAPPNSPYPQGGSPYPQGGSPYPQGSPQPIQPVQYPYANNGYPPAYNYASGGYYAPNNYGYSNGYGVNYYYVRNPMGLTPTPGPYGAVANQRTVENAPAAGWPAPANAQVAVPGGDPFVVPEETLPGTDPEKPPVVFHRRPNEWTWFGADYVGGFIRPMRLATPLVTEGSPNDLHAGALGQPSTTVLYGNNPVDFGMSSGIRMQAGVFLDCNNRYSLDVVGFWLFPNTQGFTANSDANGNPVIGRPIFLLQRNRQGAFDDSFPGEFSGGVQIETKTELGGVEFNARYHMYLLESLHTDLLFGFRYLRLAEQLSIQDKLNNLPGLNLLTFQGNTITDPTATLYDQDTFSTTNHFFGRQIGGHLSWEQKWYSLDAFGKVGIGATQQNVNINGSTTLATSTTTQTAVGGVLAQPSNIGSYSRTVLGIVPEFGLSIGVNVTQHIRLNLGYSILMWNQVVRPGYQIDPHVNGTQAPSSQDFGAASGPLGPNFRFNSEFFLMQSFNLGVEVHF